MLFYFTQLKPGRKYQGLLAQITSLESEKAVAESKINQLQLDMSNKAAAAESKINQLQLDMSNKAAEVEKAHKERDDLKAEVSKLQLEVKGSKTQLARRNIDTQKKYYLFILFSSFSSKRHNQRWKK